MTLRGKNALALADAAANVALADLGGGPSRLGYELAGQAEPTPEGTAFDVAGGVEVLW